jgi:hypothetical protein
MLQGLLEVILQPLFEFLLRFPGYVIVHHFLRQPVADFDETRVAWFGLVFWAVTVAGVACVWLLV